MARRRKRKEKKTTMVRASSKCRYNAVLSATAAVNEHGARCLRLVVKSCAGVVYGDTHSTTHGNCNPACPVQSIDQRVTVACST